MIILKFLKAITKLLFKLLILIVSFVLRIALKLFKKLTLLFAACGIIYAFMSNYFSTGSSHIRSFNSIFQVSPGWFICICIGIIILITQLDKGILLLRERIVRRTEARS